LVILIVGDGAVLFSVGTTSGSWARRWARQSPRSAGENVPIRNFAPIGVSGGLVFGLGKLTVEGIRFAEPAFQAVYLAQLGAIPEVRTLVEELGLEVGIEIRGNAFVDPKPAITFLWLAQAAMADGPAGPVHIEDNVATFTPAASKRSSGSTRSTTQWNDARSSWKACPSRTSTRPVS
jgi:hypothetical protein